jgi:hypothetical protein
MSTLTNQKRKEIQHQEHLLVEATEIAKQLTEERRVRLYDSLERLIESGTAEPSPASSLFRTDESGPRLVAERAPRLTRSARRKRSKSYTEETEALLAGLGPKKGLTVKQVAEVTGQPIASVYGTLVYITKSRHTVKKRGDGLWYAVARAKPLKGEAKAVKREPKAA